MVRVTTVALLERKPGISKSLFSRYWRDVHGVMAARIPGFDTYTQYHVTPIDAGGSPKTEPFEGVAVVTFDGEEDRAGLADSQISSFIQRDEENVFRRALLYNLTAGASVTRVAAAEQPRIDEVGERYACDNSLFLLAPAADHIDPAAIVAILEADGVLELHVHDLNTGDPAAWNKTDVDDGGGGRRFTTLIQGRWSSAGAVRSALDAVAARTRGQMGAYKIEARYPMVEGGRPTALGLRGLDALQTIYEAGAANQLEDAVAAAIYRL